MSKKKDKGSTKGKASKQGNRSGPNIVNKKARFDYHLLEKLEAGMVLLGSEVKSLRNGKASLQESFCRIKNGELYLVGCNIAPYEQANVMNHEPLRQRKLLIHKRELKKIEAKLAQKGLTLVPLRIYFSRGRAKIEIALARGKSYADKRDTIRQREQQRDMKRAMQQWR